VQIKIFNSLSLSKISKIYSFFLISLIDMTSFKVEILIKPIFKFSYFKIFLSFLKMTFFSSSYFIRLNSLIFFIISSKFILEKSKY